jgi:hypothetical protein
MERGGSGQMEPLRWGSGFMVAFLNRLFCNAGERGQQLKCYLGGKTLTWGSGCSGTDSPSWVFTALAQITGGVFVHRFSAESSQEKRRFLLIHSAPQQMFADIFDLSRKVAHCCLARSLVTPLPANLLFVGFSCKTVSNLQTLNPLAAGSAIHMLQGTTGDTFWATCLALDIKWCFFVNFGGSGDSFSSIAFGMTYLLLE